MKLFSLLFLILSIASVAFAATFPNICNATAPESPIKAINQHASDTIKCLRDQLSDKIIAIFHGDAPLAAAAYDKAEQSHDGSNLQQSIREIVIYTMFQMLDAVAIQFHRVENIIETAIHNIKVEKKNTADEKIIYAALDSLRKFTRTQLNDVFLVYVRFGIKLVDVEDKLAVKFAALIKTSLPDRSKMMHQERGETEELTKNMLTNSVDTIIADFQNIIDKLESIAS